MYMNFPTSRHNTLLNIIMDRFKYNDKRTHPKYWQIADLYGVLPSCNVDKTVCLIV